MEESILSHHFFDRWIALISIIHIHDYVYIRATDGCNLKEDSWIHQFELFTLGIAEKRKPKNRLKSKITVTENLVFVFSAKTFSKCGSKKKRVKFNWKANYAYVAWQQLKCTFLFCKLVAMVKLTVDFKFSFSG